MCYQLKRESVNTVAHVLTWTIQTQQKTVTTLTFSINLKTLFFWTRGGGEHVKCWQRSPAHTFRVKRKYVTLPKLKDALARFTIKLYSGKTLATPRSCPGSSKKTLSQPSTGAFVCVSASPGGVTGEGPHRGNAGLQWSTMPYR